MNQQFSWIYADLIDKGGNAFVAVYSAGLPFLAGSRSHSEHSLRPSLHLACYAPGRPHHYLLQELEPRDTEFDWATGNARLGRSYFRINSNQGRRELEANLDVDLPGGDYFRGTLRLRGAAFTGESQSLELGAPGTTTHLWRPLAVHAHGELELRSQKNELKLTGSGYLDSNSSQVPLHEQAITRWDWGRLSFSTHTLVYYRMENLPGTAGQLYLLWVDNDGNSEQLAATVHRSQSSLSPYGVLTRRQLEFSTKLGIFAVHLTHRVDQSPFYERYCLTARSPWGEAAQGVGEVVLPTRVDRPWMRPFVRMRTHHLNGPNSMWLPLFSGASGTPFGRLVASLRRGAPHA